MIKTPKPENLAKLTPEQLEVYQSWLKEREATNILIDQSLEALARGDMDRYRLALKTINELIPDVCEHGRSIWSSCVACDELWETLFPEDFANQQLN